MSIRCRLLGHEWAVKTRKTHDPQSLRRVGVNNDLLRVCERCGDERTLSKIADMDKPPLD